MDQLASRVSSKLEEGNYRGAVRLAYSEDIIADPSSETLQALKAKHPPQPSNSNMPALKDTPPLHHCTLIIIYTFITKIHFKKGTNYQGESNQVDTADFLFHHYM